MAILSPSVKTSQSTGIYKHAKYALVYAITHFLC